MVFLLELGCVDPAALGARAQGTQRSIWVCLRRFPMKRALVLALLLLASSVGTVQNVVPKLRAKFIYADTGTAVKGSLTVSVTVGGELQYQRTFPLSRYGYAESYVLLLPQGNLEAVLTATLEDTTGKQLWARQLSVSTDRQNEFLALTEGLDQVVLTWKVPR